MKVQKADLLLYTPTYQTLQNKNSQNAQLPQITSYNPPAYRDFNIKFGGRLFRTPANFFEFNQNRLPETMQAYLNEDYEDRKNMPPIQMWKTVYGGVADSKNLEEVKNSYPDESLFKNLKNKPNRAISSVVSQIQALEDEFDKTPLFKDGSSDLGMYLLKKIYTEGKQINEINKDFKNDLNEGYKGLIDKDITSDTTRAYGIKFPNVGFWNSFVVTRDDFPYEYKPRNASKIVHSRVKHERSLSDIKRAVTEDKRPPKFKPTERDLQILTDAATRQNPEAALNKIKHKGGNNSENASFVNKYFSPIMSVALEKINASDELRTFLQNPENMSKNAKERMEKYWAQNSYMKKLQSLAMHDTIKFFFEAYGADGENDEFKDLLNYADSIKPQREARRAEHDRIQNELEEALAIHEEAKPSLPATNEDITNILKEEAEKNNANVYEFETPQGKVLICSDLREAFLESLTEETKIMPKAFAKRYIDFMLKNKNVTDEYILYHCLSPYGFDFTQDDRFMDSDKADEITIHAFTDFSNIDKKSTNAAQQAVIDAFIDAGVGGNAANKIFTLGIFEFPPIMRTLSEGTRNGLYAKSDFINKKYYEYKKDLSESEINKISIVVNELLSKYNPDKTIIGSGSPFEPYPVLFGAVSKNIQAGKPAKDRLKKEIQKFLHEYGGSARVLIDKNIPENIKMAKLEQFLCHFNVDGALFKYAAMNRDTIENYVRFNNLELYTFLKNEVLSDLY